MALPAPLEYKQLSYRSEVLCRTSCSPAVWRALVCFSALRTVHMNVSPTPAVKTGFFFFWRGKKKKDRQIALLLNKMWNMQCLSLKCQLLLVANSEDGKWKIKAFLLHRIWSSWDLWKSCDKILTWYSQKKSKKDCVSKMIKLKVLVKSMHFSTLYILYYFIRT